MIKSHDDLKDCLKAEKAKYKNIHMLWLIFPVAEQDFIWKYQWILRHTEYYKNTGRHIMAALFNIWHKRISVKYGIHIPVNTCGKGLKIMHTGPILINGKATIGENVSLHINTAIVAHGNRGGVPTIGNGVVLGVGAVVLGDVRLASDCKRRNCDLLQPDWRQGRLAIVQHFQMDSGRWPKVEAFLGSRI